MMELVYRDIQPGLLDTNKVSLMEPELELSSLFELVENHRQE